MESRKSECIDGEMGIIPYGGASTDPYAPNSVMTFSSNEKVREGWYMVHTRRKKKWDPTVEGRVFVADESLQDLAEDWLLVHYDGSDLEDEQADKGIVVYT